MGNAVGKSDKWVVIIGGLKLFKGVLLLLLAIGALRLLGHDVATQLEHWIRRLNVDENNRFIHKLLEKASGISPRKLSVLSIGTFFYAGLFLTEGIGLLLKKHWAEYFTVIVTGSFLPLELYELIKEFKPLRLVLILVNAAIVAYLIWRLVHHRKKTT